MSNPVSRALILCTRPDWVGIARLPAVLARHGFEVGVVCPAGALIVHARPLARCLTFQRGVQARTLQDRLVQEVLDFRPALLFPGDDEAVRLLHDLHARLEPGEARTLLERSLGDPAHYGAVARKSALVELAARTGLPIPESRVLTGEADALDFARQVGFPVILKSDVGGAGSGVLAAENEEALRSAYRQLSARPGGVVTAQRRIEGPTAAVTLAAWQGLLLAGFAWLGERPSPTPFSPVCGVQFKEAPALLELAGQVVAHLGYSGLGSVEFLLDGPQQRPLVMELNSRPTPVGNLGELFGVDLVAALRAALLGEPPPLPAAPRVQRVALFPNEWRRDPASPVLHHPQVYHDVPWEQPELLAALVGAARV